MKKSIILALFFLLSLVRLSAQSNTVTLGGQATGTGGSASFTAGEVFYTYKTGATGSSTDGMQQTYNPTYPPTIISFTPSSGGPGTIVTITGTHFNSIAANNIVFFGAVQATVTAATETSLSVIAPAGATYAPITVLNTEISLAASSLQPFLPNFTGKGSLTGFDFMPKVDFAITGTQQPYYGAIGDLDGDGKPDLAVANYANGRVSVYHNTSSSGSITSASFAARVEFVTGGNPISVTIGDLNGDGKPELVVANNGSASVSVFRNTASSGSITTASFAAKVDFTVGTNPRSVAIGDLDGDGKADLAVANTANFTVSILRNTTANGTISFLPKVDYATGSNPHFVAFGDLDGDGKPDLATANNGNASVSVLRNNSIAGTISLETKVDFTAGSFPVSMAIGDLDADGKAEMVVTNFGSAGVSIFKNNAVSGAINNTSFASKVDFTTGSGAWSVAIGDLDGDNKPDLAVANTGVSTVSVLRNTSSASSITTSSFAAKVDFATATGTRSVAIGDLDLDGKPDFVAANYNNATLSVFRNNPSGFVIYNANGGSGTMANQKISYLGSANITANGFTRAGYMFTGWNTAADGTGTTYADLASYTMGATDITLHAQWVANSSLFITTWQPYEQTVTFPLSKVGGGTNMTINWGDGTVETGLGDNPSHNYAALGVYTVSVWGTFDRVRFNENPHNENLYIKSIEQWGTTQWSTMANAFEKCYSLQYNATDAPNLSAVTDMSRMFYNCGSLQGGNLNNWDVSNVTNMEGLFHATNSFNPAVGNWNVSNVTNMSKMFYRTTTFNQDISNWNVSNVTDMSGMFESANAFSQNIGSWDVHNVTNMSKMFYEAYSINQNIGSWNVSSVTNMSSMFYGVSSFNGDIGSWNVSSVTNMSSTFYGVSSFNQNIGNWIVSNVSDMSFMFFGAASFNQNIGGWNVSAVTNMLELFSGATSFNQNIGGWNVNSVSNMSSMFSGATSFNQNIGNWNVSNVTDMSAMFAGATSFNQNIGSWNVSNVNNMIAMFLEATSFNQNIGSWNVSAVGAMFYMFYNATSFNQDIGGWDVSNVEYMDDMFYGATLSTANYDALLMGWASRTLKPNVNFNGGNSTFCAGAIARQSMIDTYAWNITDGGKILRDINLKGNDNNIVFGDVTPSVTDSTDFGAVALNTPSSRTYMIQNTGTADLTVSSVAISGTDATSFSVGDITLPATIAGGASTTFTVTLNAASSGVKSATVFVINNDCYDGFYNFAIKGNDFFSITFDANGGTGTMSNQSVAYLASANLTANAFTRPGYTFAGWATTNGGPVAYTDAAIYSMSDAADVTLFAQWTAINYTVTFDANGGTGTMSNQPFAYLASANLTTNAFTRGGFTFMGWATQPEGSVVYTDGATYTMSNATDVTLYAKWVSSSFVTTWQTIYYDEGITFPIGAESGTNMTIDWGDGTVQTGLDSSPTHYYLTPGTYTVSVTGVYDAVNFGSAYGLQIISIEQWGNKQWRTMAGAFAGCSNLQLNASDVPDLSIVTDMSNMFNGATSFNGNIGNWDVSNVTDMSYLFGAASSFNGNIGNWDVSNVTNMPYMFSGATSFNGNISNWDVSNVTNMEFMFDYATSFDQNIGNWNVGNVTNMTNMFQGATSFNGNIGSWNVGNVTEMRSMFLFATSFNQDIGSWNVSNVNTMRAMFTGAASFNQNIGNWNVTHVTTMRSMFNEATSFNQDISNWNVSNVTTMRFMFIGATSFNQNIGNWNVSNVTNMNGMFNNATSFNQEIGGWSVSNVTDMSYMFGSAISFNGNIDNWNVSSVTNMSNMFGIANSFNQNIGNWNVSSVTNMVEMFYKAASFNQNIGGWNVGNVTDMFGMFSEATSFNQNIGNWNVSNVEYMDGMFAGVTLSTANYDSLLMGWAPQTLKPSVNFDGGFSTYCAGESARQSMIDTYGWIITDGGNTSPVQYYIDADLDGFGSSTTETLCSVTAPTGYSTNNTDCDDTSNSIWRTGDFYTDADGDNYTVGTVQSICYGANTPSGYSVNSLGEDCDDTNSSIWRTGDFYTDADGDNYTVGTVQSICYGANTPSGYSLNSLGTDCNDNNAQVNPGAAEICNGIDDNCDGIVDFGPFGTPTSVNGPSAVCRTQSFVFTTDAVVGATSYQWTLPSNATGTSTSNSISVTFASTFTGGSICVKAVNQCGPSAQVCKTLTVITATSATPSTISGTTSVCANSTENTYTIAAVANASNYIWTAPSNATLVSGQGTTTATFSFQTAYTIGSISVKSSNCFGTSAARTLTVTKKAISATPGMVTGPASFCAGTQQTFSIAAVSGASNYTWTAPANASIVSGQGSLSVVVEFTSAFVSGNVTVASSNCSGTSTARTKAVTKTALPGTVGTISGVTAGACSANTRTYTVAAVSNTTSYEWTAPVNASIVNGQGTTSVEVQFEAGFTTGTLSVKGVNCSGTSVTARTLALTKVTSTPTVLTGNFRAVCAGSTQTYSTTAVTGATSYVWTVPTGAVINGASNGTSISVTFPSPFTSGVVSVKSATECYTSAAKSLTVYAFPGTPTSITGPLTGVCSGSTQTYTCTASTTGATGYNWTVPAGATILTGATTNSITVQFPTPFISGTVSVKAYNTCGESAAKSVTVSSVIAQPGSITGTTTNLCSGGSFTYSIAAVTGATGYSWNVPAGWIITANSGTSITVNIPTTGFTSASISVAAQNACGFGVVRSLTLSALPATPAAIAGSNSVCPSATGLVYSTPAVSGVSYTWTVPTGATITAGQGTNSIDVTWGTIAGSVTVKAKNACGTNNTAKTLAVTLASCRLGEEVAEETSLSTELSVYPNPTAGNATVVFGTEVGGKYTINVLNALGQVVYSKTASSITGENTHAIDISELSSGLYFINLLEESGMRSLRLVKK